MLTRVSHNEKNNTYIQIIAHTIVYKSCMCVVVYQILTFVYLHNKKDVALIIILLLFIFFMIALQNLTREATINVLTNLQKAI